MDRCSMRLANARQLITQVSTLTILPSRCPAITAILPRAPYLSLYDTTIRKVSVRRKQDCHEASVYRLPFKLNWLVLLTSSSARGSYGFLESVTLISASL